MKIFAKIANSMYFMAAISLILLSLWIMGWSLYQPFMAIRSFSLSINILLDSVGAIVISIAVLDLSKYLIEEEVYRNKELRSPSEARKTVTKLFVITSIAAGMEGLVYIFKAGNKDLTLLVYPGLLILLSSISIVCLGIYQKLSISVETIDQDINLKY